MRKVCPNCFNIVSKGEECPVCHYNFKAKTRTVKSDQNKTDGSVEEISGLSPNLESLYKEKSLNEEFKENKISEKQACASDMFHQKNGRIKWVSKSVREGKVKTPKKVINPRVGGVHIDTSKYSFFGKTYNKYNPSAERIVVENNGKYELEKLKWWEIYKWADRQLAKNKIKKIVKKESIKKPEKVSFGVLLSLCLFSGFLGVHNFYAGNIKKGLTCAISFAVAMIFVVFLNPIKFFATYFQGILCAIPGLICIVIWLTDFIAILFKRFKYKKSKMDFIKSLDIETRARLGKKYIYIV